MPPRLKKKIYSPNQRQKPNFSLGCRGEKLATEYLLTHGFQIIETNLLGFGQCEIDLIAWDHNCQPQELVFIEVKTRSSDDFGAPSLAVNRHKLSQLTKASQKFLQRRQPRLGAPPNYRYDVITLLKKPTAKRKKDSELSLPDFQLEHYQNVTW